MIPAFSKEKTRAKMLAQEWIPEGLGADAVEMCSPL